MKPRVKAHKEQCDRIRAKLKNLRAIDVALKIFGAEAHQYKIGGVVPYRKIEEFERRYAVALPDSFAAFLCLVGNGRRFGLGMAAGPGYGILPLGKCPGQFPPFEEGWLAGEPMIHTGIQQERWEAHYDELFAAGPDASREDWKELDARLFAGVLPVCYQGCSNFVGLMLSGPQKGSVVDFTTEPCAPIFLPFDSFLDWYESWLDRSISEMAGRTECSGGRDEAGRH